jgi:hypothetical protein
MDFLTLKNLKRTMAKFTGIIPMRGTIENMTYAHTKYGIIVRKKTSMDRTRVISDPKFQRTRENMLEFGTARKAGSLLYRAFRTSLPQARETSTSIRMATNMRAALELDTTNARGYRTVTDGDLGLIENFEFNEQSRLSAVLQAPFTPSITRATGELEVQVPAYDTLTAIAAPQGATHLRIVATGVEADFVNKHFVADIQRSGYLALTPGASSPVTLTTTVTANSTKPLFLGLGIEFFQELNGVKYPLKDGTSNCHTIVKVDA